jgi:hypothetical protein
MLHGSRGLAESSLLGLLLILLLLLLPMSLNGVITAAAPVSDTWSPRRKTVLLKNVRSPGSFRPCDQPVSA